MKHESQNLAAPCGVYCGACPSYYKGTCYGCSSGRTQKRTSKWGCKIRRCCVGEHKFDSCSQCCEFPCTLITRLQKSHLGEKKFRYREEIVDNLRKIKEIGKMNWLKEQQRTYACPKCQGSVVFYLYECLSCRYKMD
jgi:hypothetical protein